MSISRLTMLDFERVARHAAQGVVSDKSRPRHHDGADHSRVKQVLFQVGRDGGLSELGQTG